MSVQALATQKHKFEMNSVSFQNLYSINSHLMVLNDYLEHVVVDRKSVILVPSPFHTIFYEF